MSNEKEREEQQEEDTPIVDPSKLNWVSVSNSKSSENTIIDEFDELKKLTSKKDEGDNLNWMSATNDLNTKNEETFKNLNSEIDELNNYQIEKSLKEQLAELKTDEDTGNEFDEQLNSVFKAIGTLNSKVQPLNELDREFDHFEQMVDEMNDELREQKLYDQAVTQVTEGLSQLTQVLERATNRIKQATEKRKQQNQQQGNQ